MAKRDGEHSTGTGRPTDLEVDADAGRTPSGAEGEVHEPAAASGRDPEDPGAEGKPESGASPGGGEVPPAGGAQDAQEDGIAPYTPQDWTEIEDPEAKAGALRELSDEDLIALAEQALERDKYLEELRRARADLDNHQKRVRRERPVWEDHAVRGFVADFLPLVDNFELALSSADQADAASLKQGVEMIYHLLRKILEDCGVEEIPAEGEMFDPKVHEAVAAEEVTEGDDNRILEVQQKGYHYKGVVVRPSRVKVARKVEARDPANEEG